MGKKKNLESRLNQLEQSNYRLHAKLTHLENKVRHMVVRLEKTRELLYKLSAKVDTLALNYASPPGNIITDLLKESGLTRVQLAELFDSNTTYIGQLIIGEIPIDEEIAIKLEKFLGGSVGFWLNREAQYRAQLAKIEGKFDQQLVN